MVSENKIIFLTGIAGFIGYHTAKRLQEEGYKVIGIDNLNTYYDPKLKLDRLKELGLNYVAGEGRCSNEVEDIVFYFGDIQDAALLNRIYEKENFSNIIHLAAQAGVRFSIDAPHAYIDTNVKGFLNILELARANPMKHVVYASSSSVYGLNAAQPFSEDDDCNNPISLYAATKKANEGMANVYAWLYKLNLTGLRFFTVYGPWGRPDMAPMLFADAAYNDKPIRVFNYGKQSRDFTFIDDIVDGILLVFENNKDKGHTLFNIGNGAPVNLLSFIETLEEVSGKTIEKTFIEAQPGDVTETFADITKLSDTFGFKPKVQIQEGIRKFNDWYRIYFSELNKESN